MIVHYYLWIKDEQSLSIKLMFIRNQLRIYLLFIFHVEGCLTRDVISEYKACGPCFWLTQQEEPARRKTK